jgi:dTDP-glucose 4,6-dehydratase
VTDTVNGFIKAAEAENILGKTLNLGTGQEIRIGELAERIIRKTGNKAVIEVESQRLRPEASEVFRLLSDNSQARQELNWQPEVDLDQGLDHTIDWIEANLALFRTGKYEF